MPKKEGLSSSNPPLEPPKKKSIYQFSCLVSPGSTFRFSTKKKKKPAPRWPEENAGPQGGFRVFREWINNEAPWSLVHGDFHPANCMLEVPSKVPTDQMYPSPRLFHPPETDATARSCFK